MAFIAAGAIFARLPNDPTYSTPRLNEDSALSDILMKLFCWVCTDSASLSSAKLPISSCNFSEATYNPITDPSAMNRKIEILVNVFLIK